MTADTGRLVLPDARYERSAVEAIAEFRAEGRDPGTNQPQEGEPVAGLRAMDDPDHAPDWPGPQTMLWLVEGNPPSGGSRCGTGSTTTSGGSAGTSGTTSGHRCAAGARARGRSRALGAAW